MAYIVQATILARISRDVGLRAFDRDGVGDIDAAFVATCIAEAQSEWDLRVGASFPMPLDTNGAVVDERIKGALVAMALYCGWRYSPLATSSKDGPFRQAYLDALDLADRLRKDDGARLKTAYGGPAKPLAVVGNIVQADGLTPTNPFTRIADSKDPSGF